MEWTSPHVEVLQFDIVSVPADGNSWAMIPGIFSVISKRHGQLVLISNDTFVHYMIHLDMRISKESFINKDKTDQQINSTFEININ